LSKLMVFCGIYQVSPLLKRMMFPLVINWLAAVIVCFGLLLLRPLLASDPDVEK
jgi:hypothetical protein